jgi:tRNA (guanosine-2'-O-)-methyltransferase
VRQLDGTGLKRLHRAWRERTRGRLALVLDGLGTPANVGAIVRTAAAYRVERLWLAGVPTGVDAVAAAHDDGFAVVGIELCDDAVPLHELDLPDAVCLAVGHEDHGLARATVEACDHVAFLPQLGRVGSLNVATAAALAIYEVRRRSWAGSN